jgi:hypothetical protein
MAELSCMNIVGWMKQLFERRWLLVTLGIAIGLASALLLRLKLEGVYYEYWVFPRDKTVDDYIYPQLRYAIFDVVLLLWYFDGLIFSVVAIRSAVACRSISAWPFRILLLYFALLAFLILGGTLMLVARRHLLSLPASRTDLRLMSTLTYTRPADSVRFGWHVANRTSFRNHSRAFVR